MSAAPRTRFSGRAKNLPHDVYAPYAPLNIPKPAGCDIWIVDGPEIRFSYLGLKLPFPTRMTIVRLPDGGVWLHSPTHLDDGLVAAVEAIGAVCFLVAPNSLHYWWIPDWSVRFADAETYTVPGLERVAKRRISVRHSLAAATAPPWAGIIDQVLIAGDVLIEMAFFHRPSRTLILTDVIENFELQRVKSWFFRQLIRVSGAADPDGKAPIDMRLSFLRHRKALKSAVEQMITWKPKGIILAHGRCYTENGVAELRRAFRWTL